jgi:hypothetical protein
MVTTRRVADVGSCCTPPSRFRQYRFRWSEAFALQGYEDGGIVVTSALIDHSERRRRLPAVDVMVAGAGSLWSGTNSTS